MRKAMGDVYRQDGYFHIESLLNPGLAPWTREEATAYAELLKGLVVLTQIDLVFWIIHPRGFGLLLRKSPEITYSEKAKWDALCRIGDAKFAERWQAQGDKSAKPLSSQHTLKRDIYTSLSKDLGSFVKTLKQRISSAYNNDKQFVGPIWRDRAKAFNLPDNSTALSEVAAFILAQAAVQSGVDCLDYPGTVHEIRSGHGEAGKALRSIFKGKASAQEHLDRLLKLRDEIEGKVSTPIKLSGRGRPKAWRPECECG